MSRSNAAINICLIILLLSAVVIAGCTIPFTNDSNTTQNTALTIALNYPDIASELKNSNNDYAATATPADPAITGYYDYSANFYYVKIDTADNGIPVSGLPKNYLGHYQVLVDVDRRQVMAIQYSYDVATMPWHILLPAHTMWYQKLRSSGAYVEMDLDNLNQSVNGRVINYNNIAMMRDDRPYMAFRLSELGENAKTFQFSGNHTAIQTLLYNVTVIPGRMVYPGNFINGSGVSFTFHDPDHGYYFVLANNGPADATIDVMIY